MDRRPVVGHRLYTKHQLESGVLAPFSESGRDPTRVGIKLVLNPLQGVASPRVLANKSFGHLLDRDPDFIYESLIYKNPKHINDLEVGIDLRRRFVVELAKLFVVDKKNGYRGILSACGSDVREIPRRKDRSLAFIQEDTAYSLYEFNEAVVAETRLRFEAELTRLKTSKRRKLGDDVKQYINSHCNVLKRLEETLKTGNKVVKEIRYLYSTLKQGQLPDLVTVERIVETPQTYDEMPRVLCEAAFHGKIDPTRIFLDFTAHEELLLVASLLGRANFGLIGPSMRQAKAFLSEIMGEDRRPVLPIHVPMHTLLLEEIEGTCDWRPHQEVIARICREVIDHRRREGEPERVQLWHPR